MIKKATGKIRKALEYVRTIYPLVDRVTYDETNAWCYEGPKDYLPSFTNPDFDVSTLEDARDDAEHELNTTYLF